MTVGGEQEVAHRKVVRSGKDGSRSNSIDGALEIGPDGSVESAGQTQRVKFQIHKLHQCIK